MNLPTLATVTDNITEILLKIIAFTQNRHKILIQNINGMRRGGFVPKDLPVEEFSKLMYQALTGHVHSQRLVLRDGPNVKFGANGCFEVMPIIDEQASMLFEQNPDEYLRGQIGKLLENSLNQRIAMELFRQKQANEQCLRCPN